MKYGSRENPYGAYRRGDPKSCGGESCATCKYTLPFGRLIYCTYTSQRIALWETIRWARSTDDEMKKCGYCHGCMACKHVTKGLSCDTCAECLATEELVNFEPAKDLIEWEAESNKERKEI